jgi:hypothetical protein
MKLSFEGRKPLFTEYRFGKSVKKIILASPKINIMKNTFTYSAFLFAVLFVSALAANAQSGTPVKQETTRQQVTQPEAFFRVESLDNARNKMEDAYIKYQNATADQAEGLGAEFRHLRRLYLVALEKETANYPSTTETGSKIRSEMLKTSKDMR